MLRQNDRGGFSAGVQYGQAGIAPTSESWIAYNPGTQWHAYRFEASGNRLRLLIDGALRAEITDNRCLSNVRTGLWCTASQINVRSFKVFAL